MDNSNNILLDLSNQVARLSAQITKLQEEHNEVKAELKALTAIKNKGLGALTLLLTAASLCSGLLTYFITR